MQFNLFWCIGLLCILWSVFKLALVSMWLVYGFGLVTCDMYNGGHNLVRCCSQFWAVHIYTCSECVLYLVTCWLYVCYILSHVECTCIYVLYFVTCWLYVCYILPHVDCMWAIIIILSHVDCICAKSCHMLAVCDSHYVSHISLIACYSCLRLVIRIYSIDNVTTREQMATTRDFDYP